MEERHLLEFEEFNLEWDELFAKIHEEAEELQEAMQERHREQLLALQNKLQTTLSITPKWSPELLNHKQIFQLLKKQKKYI